MSNVFQQLELEAFRKGITPRTKESIAWFRKRAGEMHRVNRKTLMKSPMVVEASKPKPGRMGLFMYDPKHKDTLPYYDTFPLIVFVGPAPGGFHGLNLHYLPPIARAKLLDGLMSTMNNKKYDETTKFKISYNMLKSTQKVAAFAPCFKHYLTNHVRSRFSLIEAPEWEIATFLPLAQWKGASQTQIWRESRKKY